MILVFATHGASFTPTVGNILSSHSGLEYFPARLQWDVMWPLSVKWSVSVIIMKQRSIATCLMSSLISPKKRCKNSRLTNSDTFCFTQHVSHAQIKQGVWLQWPHTRLSLTRLSLTPLWNTSKLCCLRLNTTRASVNLMSASLWMTLWTKLRQKASNSPDNLLQLIS